jgi:hypothetical protein
MKIPIVLMSTLLGFGCDRTQKPQSLAVKDYDDFYNLVVLKAKNGDKAEWLASYDEIVGFIERVRQEVEKLPTETQLALARAVHDNGYWKGQELRVRDSADPFLGARFRSRDESLKGVLTAKGFDDYGNRYAQAGSSFRISLDAVADREGLYRLEGKTIPGLSQIPANTAIINANAQSWDDLVADAQLFPNPSERLAVIMRNQLNAIAAALSLLRGSQAHSDAEMDYATAVIWRYTGHYNGKDGWDRESLVRLPYSELSEAEKAKDRDVWKAVREALKTHPF